MELPKRMLAFSLLGWVVLIFITYILAILGLADPASAVAAVFQKYEVTSTLNAATFGPIFNLWVISASIPISVMALSSSPLLIESIFPFILVLIMCGALGYVFGVKKGLMAICLLVVYGIVFGVLLGFLTPLTLPAAALSPEDQAVIQGLGGSFAKLTVLMPINLLPELILTMGLCLGTGLIGGFIPQKFSGIRPKRKKKKKKK